jgi:hypothetical protein
MVSHSASNTPIFPRVVDSCSRSACSVNIVMEPRRTRSKCHWRCTVLQPGRYALAFCAHWRNSLQFMALVSLRASPVWTMPLLSPQLQSGNSRALFLENWRYRATPLHCQALCYPLRIGDGPQPSQPCSSSELYYRQV